MNEMKHSVLILVAVFSVLLCGCGKDDPVVEDYIASVTVRATGNALRYEVAVGFRKDCEFQVSYWKTADPSEVMTTSTAASEGGRGTKTLMFLYPETEYAFRVEVSISDGALGTEPVTFTTAAIPPEVPAYKVAVDNGCPEIEGYLMQFQATSPGYVTFCDLEGNVVWYEQVPEAVRQAWFSPERNEIAMNIGFGKGEGGDFQRIADRFLVIGLDGRVILDTPCGSATVENPHHEIKILPDGNLLILHNVVKTMDLTSLGGGSAVPVYGEGFVVTDRNWRVLKSWDMFDHVDILADNSLDPVRFCNDLVHANSVDFDAEGNAYMTLNRLSELWKIDGKTGEILYRFGEKGDIALDGKFPVGGLHSAVVLAPDKVLCFNNGRGAQPSRGLIAEVDPASRKARYALDIAIPLEYSSINRGNVTLIGDGSMLLFGSTVGKAGVITDLKGSVLKVITREGMSYRTYWFHRIEY